MFSIGRTGHFVGTALVPIAAYVAFRDYMGVATPLRRVAMLCAVPVVSIALAASNAAHELMWAPPAVNAAGEFLTRPSAWGPWFLFVHLPYSYGVIGVAVLGLLMHSSAVARGHRRGLWLLVGAALPPTLAALAYDVGLGPDTFSYVPLVFAAMLPAYAWLIVGEQIVRFTPLAYETVFHNMRDPVIVIDDRCRVIGLNRTAESLLRLDETQALSEPLEQLFGDDAASVFDALDSGTPRRMLTETGRYLHVQASPIEAGHRGGGGHVLMFRDVSDVELAQQEVRRSEKLLRTLVDHSANGIVRLQWSTDASGRRLLSCIFANAAAGRFLDADPAALATRSAREILGLATCGMEIDAAADVHEGFDRAMLRGDGFEAEVCHRRHGEGRWLRLIAEPVGDDIALTFVDITDNKARERHMESMATSDPLTGVLNRRGFERDASRRLAESRDDATGALLFVDLNNFKEINDQFGHDVGDRLLRIAAERLTQSLRSCDIIGRPAATSLSRWCRTSMRPWPKNLPCG